MIFLFTVPIGSSNGSTQRFFWKWRRKDSCTVFAQWPQWMNEVSCFATVIGAQVNALFLCISLSFEIKIRMDLWGSPFCGFVRWASLWVLQALENLPAWQAPPCPWIICYCWPQFIDIVKVSPWYVVFGEAAWMFDQGAGTFIIPYQNIPLRNVYKREVWHPEIKMGLYSYDTNYHTSNSETRWTNAHKSCVSKQ